MPRINPNSGEGDPLWPKPPGWALKYLRPAPPMPPGLREEDIDNERQNYVVDPENRPAVVPKGDEQTGQKIGPAFTKLPRQDQRQTVDKTFDQMVSDARQLKGSVFATPFDKALRFGTSDQMGGLGPQPMTGVVTNPTHRVFKEIMEKAPDLGKLMLRQKAMVELAEKPAPLFDLAGGSLEGITQTFKPSQIPAVGRAVQKGQGARGIIPIEPDELQRLLSNLKERAGATLQQYPSKHNTPAPKMISREHENLHTLYSDKTGGRSLVPDIAPARATDMMHRVLERANMPPEERFRVAAQYAKDPVHGLIEAIAIYKRGRFGGGYGR